MSTLELTPKGHAGFGIALGLRAEARLSFSEVAASAILLVGGESWSVEGVDRRNEVLLGRLRDRNLPRTCWVAGCTPKSGNTERLVLQVHEFPTQYVWPDSTDLAVDEKVVDQIRARLARSVTVQEAVEWLSDAILLPALDSAGEHYVFLSGSPNPQADRNGAFRLHGNGFAIDAKRDPEDRLAVTRVVETRRAVASSERRPIVLLRGKFRFCDATLAGAFRGTAKNQLDQLVEGSRSYLDWWRKYNTLERDSILRRARKLGGLRYSGCKALADGSWRFTLEASPEIVVALGELRDGENTELEVSATLPRELLSGDLGTGPSTAGPAPVGPRGRTLAGALAACSPEQQTVDLRFPGDAEDRTPPEAGYVFLSWSGDKKRLERREKAAADIASAACPMPQLGLLIEGMIVPERRRKTYAPLSPAVRAAFGGNPTDRQIEALQIALNTPDIALIQGPPGTGKTRIIAALVARLAEISEGAEGVAGQTLLTSYQHDAVEHAASQTVVFGLPAMKIGNRQGTSDGADGFDRWRRERIEAVRAALAQLPEPPATEILRRVRLLASRYVGSPIGQADAALLLKEVRDLISGRVPLEISDRLLSLQQGLQRGATENVSEMGEDRDSAIKALRALRTTTESFMDDGPRSALRALRRLEVVGTVQEDERELLERAAGWGGGEPPDFVDALRDLQSRRLDSLVADQRPPGAPSLHSDVEEALGATVDVLNRHARESIPGVASVLYDYLNALELDADGVRDAVGQYTTVLAATCQQAVANQMSQAKRDAVVFDSVIVDEAARANPLDMFIPMALAERRIVLVGDHRQLPHILEPDIESQLEQSVSTETRRALRMSLFERLFQTMKAREAADGIKRTITLDIQYRMHPVLGEFVSNTFYAPHGEAFKSGQLSEHVSHDLVGYEGKVATWASIPRAAGEERGGRSKRRKAEALWIAKELKRLSTQRTDLSFGVISFYAAQVDELFDALEKLGLAERSADGGHRVAPEMRETRGRDGRLKERLRVGTVDAFQGKEFDVVFLSMTRSNDLPADTERALRKKYGHLMLENRLCVAMSRQQRLLVVAGDEEMIRGEAALRALPGLIAFHNLCEGPHGQCISA